MDFSRPGKPTDNAFIESFNGSFRDECLNTHHVVCYLDLRVRKGDGGFAMTPHPRYHHTLEDLFLTVFVHIDDWLKPCQFVLPKQPAQKASYSELFTIAIVGEILAQPYESTWYWIVQQTFRSLFPDLPHYTRLPPNPAERRETRSRASTISRT